MFRSYGRLLSNMVALKYLSHILMDTENDLKAVVAKLTKVMNKWVQMSNILSTEKGNARVEI